MNKKIRDLVEEHRREKWTEHLEKCDLRSGVKRLWNTIKTLSGNVKKTGSQAVTFEKPVYNPKEIANKLNQQYTPPIRKKVLQETRQTLRKLKTSSTERAVITTMEVERVLQSTNPSKALGPDELSPLMLKHLGPKAHSYIQLHCGDVPDESQHGSDNKYLENGTYHPVAETRKTEWHWQELPPRLAPLPDADWTPTDGWSSAWIPEGTVHYDNSLRDRLPHNKRP